VLGGRYVRGGSDFDRNDIPDSRSRKVDDHDVCQALICNKTLSVKIMKSLSVRIFVALICKKPLSVKNDWNVEFS